MTKHSKVGGKALEEGKDHKISQKSSHYEEDLHPESGWSWVWPLTRSLVWRFLCEKLRLNSPPGSESHGSLPICAMPYLWLQNSLEVRGQLLEKMAHQESGPPVSHTGDHCALLRCRFSWVGGDPSLRAWGSIQKHCNKWPHDCCTRICVCINQPNPPTALLLGPWVSPLGSKPCHSRGPFA